MPTPRNIRDLIREGRLPPPRTQGVAARGSRRPAGGARTSRDGPGGGPGIPSLARRRPREVPIAPPRTREHLSPPFMGIGGLVQRMQMGGPAQVGLGGMGRPGMGQQLQAPPMMPPGMPPGMPPPGMAPPGMPPPGMGLQGMGQQRAQPMGGAYQQAMAGYGQPMGMGLGGMGRPGMGQQRRDMGQQLSARSQLAGAQPGRAATRGIGPGMAYGGVPRLQGGQQVPPMPMGPPPGPPPGPALGGGGPNRLDALRGAPDIPLAGGPGGPGGPGPGGPPIEEEGDPTEGLSAAIAETALANAGDPFQALEILDQAIAMVEAELPEEDTGGVPDIEALLGGGGGGPDIGAMLGGGGGGPDPMAMV